MRELRARFDDLDEVREGLQDAIELELSTIPPYLYALWSIKDRQSRAAQLILNVVAEEMLHLALAANVLNAIGGQPRLHPDVAPTYPGSLPAGVDKGLVVGLRRCDAAQLEVFRQIEAPEDPGGHQSVRLRGVDGGHHRAVLRRSCRRHLAAG